MVNNTQSYRTIRQRSNKPVVLARLLDVTVIGLTLWAILDMASLAWDNKHTWWLLISVVSFGVFASFNELYRGSRAMSTYTEVKLIAVSWFCVLIVLVL